jgi:hypothetical protein
LIEQRPDGSVRYAFSNLPAHSSRLAAVRYWRSRWPVEQGYQQIDCPYCRALAHR